MVFYFIDLYTTFCWRDFFLIDFSPLCISLNSVNNLFCFLSASFIHKIPVSIFLRKIMSNEFLRKLYFSPLFALKSNSFSLISFRNYLISFSLSRIKSSTCFCQNILSTYFNSTIWLERCNDFNLSTWFFCLLVFLVFFACFSKAFANVE